MGLLPLSISKVLAVVVAASCITNVIQYMRADAFKSDIESRDNTIAQQQLSIKQSNAEIASLTQELGGMSQLLVERANQNNEVERQLQHDIEALQKELDAQKGKPEIDCLHRPWPSAIADKLRQAY